MGKHKGKMTISGCVITNVGNIRKNNEDNFYLNGSYKADTSENNMEILKYETQNTGLFSVCDGMGGEAKGELASLIAVSTMSDYQQKFAEKLDAYIYDANKRVCTEIQKYQKRMGSTVAALYIENGMALAVNLGDSRIYKFQNRALTQITKDHTLAKMLVDAGLLEPGQMQSHKGKHQLTQNLGIFPEERAIEPFVVSGIEVGVGERFLLCSDGLTDMLTDQDIEGIMASGLPIDAIAKQLIALALERGGKDNVTVMLIECKKDNKATGTIIGIIMIGILLIIICVLAVFLLFSNNKKNNQKPTIGANQSVTEENTGQEGPEEKDENQNIEKNKNKKSDEQEDAHQENDRVTGE